MAGRCRSSVDPAASRAGSRRLAVFTDELRETLASAATIETGRVGPYSAVSLEPRRTDALGISWLHSDDEVVLSVGSGGRWELEPTEQDVQYLEDIVLSVVAGRVAEVKGKRRARVLVTLADGTVDTSTVYDGLRGLLPRPARSRGTRRTFAPYQ